MLNSHAVADFSWRVISATGVSGASDGNRTSIQQTLTATTASPGTVVYKVTPTAYTCKGDSIDVTITVNPNPTAVVTIPPTDKTICSGETTNIQLTSATPGTTFSWTVNQTDVSGGVSGTGNSINQLLTLLGTTPGKAVYTITGGANGCSGAVTIDSIMVNPIPTLQVTPLDQEICSGAQIDISMTSNLPNAQFVWTVTPGSITGASGGGPTNIPSIKHILTNPGSEMDSVIYKIIATADGCTSDMGPLVDSTKAKILVNPKPIASAVTPEISCSGDSTAIELSSTVTGSTFIYTATTLGVSGAGDGAGDKIIQKLIVNAVTDSVIYMITPTSSKGCVGDAFRATAIVHPRPVITYIADANFSICSGNKIDIGINSNVNGTQIFWVPRASSVIGANSGSGFSPVKIEDVLSVTGDTAATVIYDLSAVSGKGCSNVPLTNQLKITVHPLPKIIFNGADIQVCDGTMTALDLKSNVSGTTFSWTVVQTDVTGAYADSNKTAIEQLLNLTGINKGTVVYTVTAHSPALCASAETKNISVRVNPLDDASFNYSSLNYCQEGIDPSAIVSTSFGIFSASPTGLVFSDPTKGTIDLSASSPGDYKINYTTNGVCPQQRFKDISIKGTPQADITSVKVNGSHCGTRTGSVKGITMVSGANPITYEWKDIQGNIVGTTLELDSVPPGVYVLKITDGNGCSTVIGNGNSLNITNVKTVFASFTSDVTSGDLPLTVQFTSTSTGTIANYNWNFDNGTTAVLKDPEVIFNEVKTNNVCLIVDDGKNECRDTICSSIEVFTNSDIRVIPNVFTPNGDGINDILKITSTGLATVHAEVYNRWGQKEYEWNTIDGGWDGRSASGSPSPDGTYYLILNATGANKDKTVFPTIRQSFTLLR